MDKENYEEKLNSIKQSLEESEALIKILLLAIDNDFNTPEMYDINYVLAYVYGKIKLINISINSKPKRVIQLVKD